MEIAIIGAGNVGRALATSSVRAGGHSVVISAIDPAPAQDAAGNAGAKAVSSNAEAVGGAETVILAVPVDAVGVIVDELGAAADGTSTAETLQSRVPSARVVKAFNTAFASRQADPVVDGVRVDGYVTGDDAEAKAAVLHLVESIGFVPIDVGPPAMSRAQEGMGLLNIRNGWPWQESWSVSPD